MSINDNPAKEHIQYKDSVLFRIRHSAAHVMAQAVLEFYPQASLAIEHSRLYVRLQKQIGELEDLTSELDKNKDLLVEAERYSALGQMAAQLVHAIRNPVTTIGGAARMLSKKVTDETWLKFLHMMVRCRSWLGTRPSQRFLYDLFMIYSGKGNSIGCS